jgi:hypothetical protein
MIRSGYTPFHDAAATDDRTTAGACGLFRPGSQAVIGVLGNSVAWGTGVPTGSSWPSLLNRSLRARFGPGITVVNGAVRASTPDFASLCWAEIWGSRRAPRLDVAVVDYSASGGASQLRALQDRIASRSIPSVGVAYCMQPLYLTLLQCAATGNADVGGSAVGREAGWDWCRRWARAAAAAASAQGTDASDEAFWCDRGKGPVRGPVAAAREVARFMAWGVLKPPLVQHAMKLYADALNGTDDQGRAGVRAAFVVAAALSAELSSEPRSVDALLTRDDAPRPSGALRFPPGGAAPAPCRRPGPPVRCRYGGHCGGHCQGAARLLRLAVRRCGGAAPQENRTPMLLSRAATALAAHECNATDYHLELRQRSAVVAFPRELLAVPRPNASVHGDGKHPGALGHVAMAASVEARRSRCNPACWRLQPRVLEAATPCTQLATPRIAGGVALALRAPRAARDARDGRLLRAELPLWPPDRGAGVRQEWLLVGRPWQQPHARLRSDGAGEHPHAEPAAAPDGGLSQRCLRMRVSRLHPRCHPRCHPCHLPLPPRHPHHITPHSSRTNVLPLSGGATTRWAD